MPSVTFSIQYKKNTGAALSAVELIQIYFFGSPPIDISGNVMSNETIQFSIESSQKEIENLLSLKMTRQAITENKDYYHDDWIQWNYVGVSYPVVKPLSLKGYSNSALQLAYPENWLSSKKQVPDEDMYHRTINLVPVSGQSAMITGSGSIGLAPYLGFFGNKTVPNYWEASYITGFKKIPSDILDAIGKQAAISIFTILGDIALGAAIASKSMSIDGLSQSIASTASAMYSAYSARITQYEKDLDRMRPAMKARYTGITFGVL